MFIRRTQTRSRIAGEPYFTYRLVEGERVGNTVKQTTLLNLGSHFDLPKIEWAALTSRIDAILHGQIALPNTLSEKAEALAQRYAAQLIALRSPNGSKAPTANVDKLVERFVEVDLDTIELIRPRSVGVEYAALSALRQSGFEEKLAALGFNRPQIAAAIGSVIGRMAHPGSELATHAWLQKRSALGELIDVDFASMDLNRLYRVSDLLYKHRDDLQSHLFATAKLLFNFDETITLYDLTNTYFEGTAKCVPKAARGRSKEKRSDCPLVTLAVVLDGSGFLRKSEIFAGNASEPATMQAMFTTLSAPQGATVVMDAGIATEANLQWLKAHGYHYVVVSRKQDRHFDPHRATEVKTVGEMTIKIHRVTDEKNGEAHLYCHSPAREQKDRAIDEAKRTRFLAILQKLADGLTKPRGTKSPDKILMRIGRAKQRYARVAQHYKIDVAQDEAGKNVCAITWEKQEKEGSAATHPGVYCLRTTLTQLDDATLWRIYTMLTNLESVFRSLKTDLGLRPVYHHIERRVEGHLFISALAYHFVHTLRLQLKAGGVDDSWETLRETLASQQRITTTLQRRDGRTVHVRKATRPEPAQQKINAILHLSSNPGGTQRTLI